MLDWQTPNAKWFVGGKTNMAHNCLDRQIELGRGEKTAILWEGEPLVTSQYSSDVAELTGYSEGMADGVRDRKASQPFQAGRSEKSRESEVGEGHLAGVYRQAYTNGYQQGFYTLDSDAVGVVGQTTKY